MKIITSRFRKSKIIDVSKELYCGGAASIPRHTKDDATELERLQEGQVYDELLIRVAPDAQGVVTHKEVGELIHR